MKGYGIEIKNNLLEKKHHQSMGVAVWLYMWLIDHMTSINEDGLGKVLGGKPIKYEDVTKDLELNQKTYSRHVVMLRNGGYINTLRTPYGIVFTVNKAFKRFGKKTERLDKNVRQSGKKRVSNIRHNKDSNNINTRDSKNHANLKSNLKSKSMERVPIDNEGNEITPRVKKTREKKNVVARRLQLRFAKMCKKELGVDPMIDNAGYFSVLRAMNQGKLTPRQVVDLFDEWFKMGKPDEHAVSITRALSNRQIEGYKVRNNIR